MVLAAGFYHDYRAHDAQEVSVVKYILSHCYSSAWLPLQSTLALLAELWQYGCYYDTFLSSVLQALMLRLYVQVHSTRLKHVIQLFSSPEMTKGKLHVRVIDCEGRLEQAISRGPLVY